MELNTTVAPGATVAIPFDFSSTDPISVVTDVNAQLSILASNIKNVQVSLESPAGTDLMILDLFSGSFTCSEADAELVLDDASYQSHGELNSENCGQGLVAYCGTYESLDENLSMFNDELVSGTWYLNVTNQDASSSIAIDASSMTIEKVTGQIQFPTFNRFDIDGNTIVPVWTVTGDQSYIVNFPGNACSDITVEYNDVALAIDCVGDYLNGFDRVWTFTDNGGRQVTCTQNFLIRRYFIEDIIFPPNYDGVKYPSFSCEATSGDPDSNVPQIELNADGFPAAVEGVAGYPQVPLR